MDKPYYLAYESRYQKVYAAGVEIWGHSPEDEILAATLEKWVKDNELAGKNVLEFACGEGGCGVILSKLGCRYHGVDIAPSAVKKAGDVLKAFPHARVMQLDMVRERVGETYDAALDCMGFHMLVTDRDRSAYLHNAFLSLKKGAPMLFFRESYRANAYDGGVESFEQWKKICGEDYDTPGLRSDKEGHEVWIPLVPGRAKSKEGYIKDMQAAGFCVEHFMEMEMNCENPLSASIYVRKP